MDGETDKILSGADGKSFGRRQREILKAGEHWYREENRQDSGWGWIQILEGEEKMNRGEEECSRQGSTLRRADSMPCKC
jgi:hypothetical protein